MTVRPLTAALLLCLLVALPAAAEKDGDSTAARFHAVARIVGTEPRPTPLHPVQGLHAEVFPIANLGVWAQSFGFSLSRRSAIYDLEGGAAWRIDDGVSLTASYRMLGLDLGYDADVEGFDFGPGMSAPFLGFAVDF